MPSPGWRESSVENGSSGGPLASVSLGPSLPPNAPSHHIGSGADALGMSPRIGSVAVLAPIITPRSAASCAAAASPSTPAACASRTASIPRNTSANRLSPEVVKLSRESTLGAVAGVSRGLFVSGSSGRMPAHPSCAVGRRGASPSLPLLFRLAMAGSQLRSGVAGDVEYDGARARQGEAICGCSLPDGGITGKGPARDRRAAGHVRDARCEMPSRHGWTRRPRPPSQPVQTRGHVAHPRASFELQGGLCRIVWLERDVYAPVAFVRSGVGPSPRGYWSWRVSCQVVGRVAKATRDKCGR